MKLRLSVLLVSLCLAACVGPVDQAVKPADTAKVTQLDDRVRVELGGSLFTEYIFKGAPRRSLTNAARGSRASAGITGWAPS